MPDRPVVPSNCFFQGSYNPIFEAEILKCKDKCFRYNSLLPSDLEAKDFLLRQILGKAGKGAVITPPFWCDYGYNIFVGDNSYSNHNLVVNDGLPVTFGDNVFIAPNCTFTTAEHALDPDMRKAGIEIAKPITVGDNVWIGAGSIVLAGAVIGSDTVIGAGSVVKGEIPSGVLAVGVPCKVKRKITEEDRHRYPMYTGKYV